MSCRRIISTFMVLGFSISASAATLVVDLNGTGQYMDIPSAIDAAADGDTVLVKPREYVITDPITFKGEGITVRGDDGPPRGDPKENGRPYEQNSVAYGNGVFVSVGEGGWTASSRDGVTWSAKVVGERVGLRRVTFARDIFVAVGDEGVILTSGDGSSWKRRTSGTEALLRGAAFGNGTFVVVGGGSKGLFGETDTQPDADAKGAVVLTSPDGATWKTSQVTSQAALSDVAFGNGTFVACSDLDGIIASRDGMAWAKGSSRLLGITFGKGTFVALGHTGALETSVDGTEWKKADSFVEGWLSRVAFCGERFIALGYTRTGFQIFASEDGTTWKSVHTRDSIPSYDVCEGGGKTIVLIANNGLLTSTDSTTWTERDARVRFLSRVAHGNGLFVAGGAGGQISTSSDGIAWDPHPLSPLSMGIMGVSGLAWGGGTWLAVGYAEDAPAILSSKDGLSWERVNPEVK